MVNTRGHDGTEALIRSPLKMSLLVKVNLGLLFKHILYYMYHMGMATILVKRPKTNISLTFDTV